MSVSCRHYVGPKVLRVSAQPTFRAQFLDEDTGLPVDVAGKTATMFYQLNANTKQNIAGSIYGVSTNGQFEFDMPAAATPAGLFEAGDLVYEFVLYEGSKPFPGAEQFRRTILALL
jgi:hypothetical protein